MSTTAATGSSSRSSCDSNQEWSSFGKECNTAVKADVLAGSMRAASSTPRSLQHRDLEHRATGLFISSKSGPGPIAASYSRAYFKASEGFRSRAQIHQSVISAGRFVGPLDTLVAPFRFGDFAESQPAMPR